MNKFLKDLEKELIKLNVSSKDISEILGDHQEMIENAKNEGLSEQEITKKFGDPTKVAQELFSDIKNESKTKSILFEAESCVDYDVEDYNLLKTFSNVDDVISFEANLVSDDLQYSTYDGDDIVVYEKNVTQIEDYTIELDNNVLYLKKKKTMKMMFNTKKSGQFLILVPTSIEHNRIEFSNVSGDANFNGLNIKQLVFKSTSGDIELSNINVEESKFSLVSGDVEIANFNGKTFDISVINGDFSMVNCTFEGNMFFNTVSGDIELNNVECLEAELRTVSGDIDGTEFYPKEISMKSVSGDIEIENSDKSRDIIIRSKKSVSGSIHIK